MKNLLDILRVKHDQNLAQHDIFKKFSDNLACQVRQHWIWVLKLEFSWTKLINHPKSKGMKTTLSPTLPLSPSHLHTKFYRFNNANRFFLYQLFALLFSVRHRRRLFFCCVSFQSNLHIQFFIFHLYLLFSS